MAAPTGARDRSVLIVEDDDEIAGLLRDFLEADGFRVAREVDGRGVLAALRSPTDCVVLDVMLPGESGFELCRRIRERSDVPVLFLSARDGDADKLRGLALGADDYVVKSATPAEVVARVNAVLRRYAAGERARRESGPLRHGRLELDVAARELVVDGRPVRTTAREFELLHVLAAHPREAFAREELFRRIWGPYGDRSAVPVYIRRLREKIEPDPGVPRHIVTVWGVGYRFDP
jgi:DNA-binding response OmpR family regulator